MRKLNTYYAGAEIYRGKNDKMEHILIVCLTVCNVLFGLYERNRIGVYVITIMNTEQFAVRLI